MIRFLLYTLAACVFTVTTMLVFEGLVWGWGLNTQVPDYMLMVSFLWGVVWGSVAFVLAVFHDR